MAKRKHLSLASKYKVADAILGNVAGRTGGLGTLDPEIQREMYHYAAEKANKWWNHNSPYSNIRYQVERYLASKGYNQSIWGLAMAYVEKVAAYVAKYGREAAYYYEQVAKHDVDTVVVYLDPADLDYLTTLAEELGEAMKPQYYIAYRQPLAAE